MKVTGTLSNTILQGKVARKATGRWMDQVRKWTKYGNGPSMGNGPTRESTKYGKWTKYGNGPSREWTKYGNGPSMGNGPTRGMDKAWGMDQVGQWTKYGEWTK